MKKFLALALSLSLVLAIGIAGTLAWLTSTPAAITNTFTIGKVDITLTEPAGEDNNRSFKVAPGTDVTKDPKVTVLASSEDSYVFVKITKGGNFDNYFTFGIAAGWTELTADSGIYYRTYDTATADVAYGVLLNDKVVVKTGVTGFATGDAPTLTFTAYAIQKAGLADATAAWTALNP